MQTIKKGIKAWGITKLSNIHYWNPKKNHGEMNKYLSFCNNIAIPFQKLRINKNWTQIHHLILSSFGTFSFNVLLFFCYPVQFWFSLIEFNLNLSLPNFVLLPYMFNYLLCLPPHLIVRIVCRLVQIRHNKSQSMYCMMI